MARSMLAVTPSPCLLTKQLLIGWRSPVRRLTPFWRSASLHTSTLSPGMRKKLNKRDCFLSIVLYFFRTRGVHSFPPCSSGHLFVCKRVQQVSVEGRGSNDDPAGREIDPWRESGGGSQDPDRALTKRPFQNVTFVKCQTCRDPFYSDWTQQRRFFFVIHSNSGTCSIIKLF